MGCDIHFYAEAKMNGKWEAAGPVKLDYINEEEYMEELVDKWGKLSIGEAYTAGRNYDLFSRLAGVRGDGAFMEPRGFPDDASYLIRKAYDKDEGDAHTPHYYTLDELKELATRQYATYLQSTMELLEEVREMIDVTERDVRAVIWFDN